jgi:hypothetical protein
MTQHRHQTTSTQFVYAAGVRFAYRRFGKSGGVLLVFNMHFFTGTMDHWDSAVSRTGTGDRRADAGSPPRAGRYWAEEWRGHGVAAAQGASGARCDVCGMGGLYSGAHGNPGQKGARVRGSYAKRIAWPSRDRVRARRFTTFHANWSPDH